ncbi:MAG TPA: DUF3311 domain-containing protein [Candidatus Eisenbacteria bacterium]
MARSRGYRWLAAVPALAILGGVPLANRVHAYVFGLPFLLFWIVSCVLLTSGVMFVVGALDRRADRETDDASPRHDRPRGAASGAGNGSAANERSGPQAR